MPDVVTTYVLTATNGGGSVSSPPVTVTVHSPSLRLQYSNPAAPDPVKPQIVVVKNSASTPSRLVLDVKVGTQPITAFGLAMNIPLAITIPGNPAVNGPFVGDSSLTPPGLISGTIQMSSSPATGAVMVGGAAMPKFISVGVAKHKATLADGDATWPANSVLFSIALKMVGNPATGDVFKGATVATDPGFRAAALRKDGTEALSKQDILLGDLIISL